MESTLSTQETKEEICDDSTTEFSVFESLMVFFLLLYNNYLNAIGDNFLYESLLEERKGSVKRIVTKMIQLQEWFSGLFNLESEYDLKSLFHLNDHQVKFFFNHQMIELEKFMSYLSDIIQGKELHDLKPYYHSHTRRIINPIDYSNIMSPISQQIDNDKRIEEIAKLYSTVAVKYGNICESYPKYLLYFQFHIIYKGIINLNIYACDHDLSLQFVEEITEACELIKIMYRPDHDDKTLSDQEKEKIKASFFTDYKLVLSKLNNYNDLTIFLNTIYDMLFPIDIP